MKYYKINEIFYSLQGEGHHSGEPAVFIRFSGCNLKCPFCDTAHENGTLMTAADIIRSVSRYPARLVVLTGGEPTLFVAPELIEALHDCGRYIAIETNGTRKVPPDIDWITLSPKDSFTKNADIRQQTCDELKVVFTGEPPENYAAITTKHRYLQPCDVGDDVRNRQLTAAAIAWCKEHPEWKLSLQLHKLIDIP